jgi:type I restriction enzyme M protein
MLDDVTKKRINSLRQILVGKLPDPKAQVEQITNGLIYKFMNDMDEQSVSMGGKSTYFSGKFEKYSWKNLMNSKTSGVEKLSLYSEALNLMSNNENLPELFRDIFKDSVLPFKDPSTLNMFLKEINEFHYSNSEKLGDAFEYLLSFMGSQGDAGQFRTPRHIIDFITEIVNPQKNETVLDPACGTAGFLISAYKHILKQNTKKNLGDGLNATDRKKIGENLNGYDISPDMVKMSLVNMYLHKFTNPKINEYDTLSSEDRWNEYYDVILANPPFFSPKGGIMPHNRFGVSSTKAEVLFIDYINEHLKPNGRAGVIVPEGVIFQSGTAYKQLRKRLIETSLIGVISLPAGIFHPYSGVKTSILILDKNLNKKIKDIFFIEIKNDGFSLNSNRNKIEGSEIGKKIELIKDFYNNKKGKDLQNINKKDILDTDDVIFNFNRYIKKDANKTKYLVKLGDVVDVLNGFAFESKNYSNSGFRILRITNVQKGQIVDNNPRFHQKLKKDNEHKKFNIEENEILVSLTGNVGRVGMVEKNLLPAYLNQRVAKIKQKSDNKNNIKFLFHILNSEYFEKEAIINSFGVAQKNLSTKWISDFQIPLPSIETQNQIVEELDNYQKIINGCTQVIENYKPSIDIDPNWEVEEIGNVCEINPKKSEVKLDNNSDVSFIPMEDVKKNNLFTLPLKIKKLSEVTTSYTYFKSDDILLAKVTPCFENGKCTIAKDLVNGVGFGSSEFIVLRCNAKVKKEWVYSFIITNKFKQLGVENFTGTSGLRRVPKDFVAKFKIPLPSIDIQEEHIKKIYSDIDFIDKNLKMIKDMQEKINNRTNSIWSN